MLLHKKKIVFQAENNDTDINSWHFHSAVQLRAAMMRSFRRVYRPRSIAELMSVRRCFNNLITKNPSCYNLGVGRIYFPVRVRPATASSHMTSSKWQRGDPSRRYETLQHLFASAPKIIEVMGCLSHQLLNYYELNADIHIGRCHEAHTLFHSASATVQRDPAM